MQTDRQGDGAPRVSRQEKQLIEMTDEKLEKVLTARLGPEGLARLKLVMSAENTAPHQTPRRARYQTPSKLVPAVMATVKLKLKEGKLKLKRYDSSMWISPMFVKAKGREDPLTGEEAVRFLSDLRALNKSLVYPSHWVQESATLDDLRGEVPSLSLIHI